MQLECSFMNWETMQWERNIVTTKRKLKNIWRDMYEDVIEPRTQGRFYPNTVFIVQPTILGLYTLEGL